MNIAIIEDQKAQREALYQATRDSLQNWVNRLEEVAGLGVFISPHRMSSCRFCSDIIVFNEGEIVERGEHNSLLAQGGLYSEMWAAQAKYYLEQGHVSLVEG